MKNGEKITSTLFIFMVFYENNRKEIWTLSETNLDSRMSD